MAKKKKQESESPGVTEYKLTAFALREGYNSAIDGRQFKLVNGEMDISDLTPEQERQLLISRVIEKA